MSEPAMKYFHEYLDILPFVLRSHILGFYNFFCGRIITRKNGDTVLLFDETKFFGVMEQRWSEPSEHPLTSSQVIRYLYGYYKRDLHRKIILVRKNIQLRFRVRSHFSGILNVSKYIPRGTVDLSVCVKIKQEETRKAGKVKLLFPSLPHTVETIFCNMETGNEDLGGNFWRNLPLESKMIKKIRGVCTENDQDLELLPHIFPNLEDLRVTMKNEQVNITKDSRSFQKCKSLRIHFHNIYSDYSWLDQLFPNIESLWIDRWERNSKSRERNVEVVSNPIPSSLITSIRNLVKLRRLVLHGTRLEAPEFRSLVHKNPTVKTLRLHVDLPENTSLLQSFRNNVLESIDICGISCHISLSLLQTLFSSFSSLLHFGIRHQISVFEVLGYSDLMRRLTLGFASRSGAGTFEVSKEALSFFNDSSVPNSFFHQLQSLAIELPGVELEPSFFLPAEKWKNLKSICISCKNDSELLETICTSLVSLESLRIKTGLLVPAHIRMISKMPNLKYFTPCCKLLNSHFDGVLVKNLNL